MVDDHYRLLEKEMLESAQSKMGADPAEKNPLLIILWRLNHQDKALEAIRYDLSNVAKTLGSHIDREEDIKESIDDMVALWKGSKLVGRIMTWVVGITAALGAAYASAKKGFFS